MIFINKDKAKYPLIKAVIHPTKIGKIPIVEFKLPKSFNSKIKAFRAQFRGVKDKDFFLFRLAKLYA